MPGTVNKATKDAVLTFKVYSLVRNTSKIRMATWFEIDVHGMMHGCFEVTRESISDGGICIDILKRMLFNLSFQEFSN